MSAESVLVAFAREGVEMVMASIAKANETEKAEIKAMLDETRARLDAIPPLAPDLDAITEKHLARVRTERLAERWGPAMAELAKGHGHPSADAFGPAASTDPVEGLDPDDA